MKNIVNNYKFLKTYNIIKKNKFFLVISLYNVKQNSVLAIKQNLIKEKINILQLKKTAAKKFFTQTIFKKLQTLINGNISLIYPDKKKKNFQTHDFFLLGIILKKKLYSKDQIVKLINFNFTSTIKSLFTLLKFLFYSFFQILQSYHSFFNLTRKTKVTL